MSGGPPPSDIFLERDSTRLVPRLDVVSGSESADSRLTFDPQAGRVRVDATGGRFLLNDSGGAQVGQLAASEREPFGFLRLQNADGYSTVTVGIDDTPADQLTGGFLTVWDEDRKPAEIQHGSGDDRWRYVLRGTDSPNPYTVASITAGGSSLEVRADDHQPTGQLLGTDAALELTSPEGADTAGELVLAEFPNAQQFEGDTDEYVDTLSDNPEEVQRDVHVQFSAADASVREQRGPRISLDGSTATLHLGRDGGSQIEEAVAGGLLVRDDQGAPIIAGNGSEAEIAISRGTGSESDTLGRISASADGLTFDDASGEPALRLEPDAIQTQNGIDEQSLTRPASFQQDSYEVMRYNIAEIDVFVDNKDRIPFGVSLGTDDSKLERRITDDPGLIEATIVPGDSDVATLLLNTRVLGDPDAFMPALEADGGADIEDVSEATLDDPPVSRGKLDLAIPDDRSVLNVNPVERPAEFGQGSYSVDVGGTVSFDVFVDDFDTVAFRVAGGDYSLDATILPADGDVVTLEFDTSLAGDSSTPPPLTVDGAATVVVESEIALSNPPIGSGPYDMVLPDFDLAALDVLASE